MRVTDKNDARKKWATYLRRMMANRSQAELAKALDVTDGQISKWVGGSSGVTAETVIEIARRLGDSPLHVLVEVGWLRDTDIAQFVVPRPYGLDEYTDLEIAREIVRRIEAGEADVGGGTDDDFDYTPEGPKSNYDLASKKGSRK